MDSLITTFHIDWKIIIAQAINFLIVFLVLYFFALKPLGKLMKEREDKIEGGINDAKNNAKLLEQTKKEYDEVLVKARKEASEIFNTVKTEAENNRKDILAKAQVEVESMIESGKKTLESEKIKMVEEAKGEIVSLVVKATEKLLESHDKDDYESKIIKQIKKM